MRPLFCALICAAALVVLGACWTGCGPREEPVATDAAPTRGLAALPTGDVDTESAKPPGPGPETEEEKLARGKQVMAQYEDAVTPPIDWSWSKDTPIDPANIPNVPAAGIMDGKLFIAKHALIQKDTDDETGVTSWELRLFDSQPPEDRKTDMFFGDRHLSLTTTNGGKGGVTNLPYDSEEWDIDTFWFWYQTPAEASPDGVSVNPNSSVAAYLEFTDWTESEPVEGSDVLGAAKGRIAVGSEMYGGDTCWVAGTFEATIVDEW